MNNPTPHYLLKTETSREGGSGRWRFVLRPLDGSPDLVATDLEPDVWGERLSLLTVVRALESLDQPSWVTLVGCTQYVEQGIAYGLADWKASGWRWECFGQMAPVRDIDLWQRMDRTLQFHRVDCGRRRIDPAHGPRSSLIEGPHWGLAAKGKRLIGGLAEDKGVKCRALAAAVWHSLRTRAAAWIQGGSRANDRVFGYD